MSPGQRLAHEMLTGMALGDATNTRKSLERSVLESVSDHLKHNPKKYLDILKEPPYLVDLENPNTPGLANLAQLVSHDLSMREGWKALLKRAKNKSEAGLGVDPETSAEAYAMIADATTDSIRAAYEKSQQN